MTAWGHVAGQQVLLSIHSSLCLSSACEGTGLGGLSLKNSLAVAERIQFWASCCLYKLHDLEQVISPRQPGLSCIL